jgi:predicted O-methyltransferase YrrM
VFASWNPSQPEITDLIVQHDPHTLQRVKVRKQEVLDTFSRYSNRQAMRAVEELSEQEGILDEKEIDRHLLKVHWEMQRLAEEFYHGHRVWELLRVVIASIRKAGVRKIIRIVDVGCGIGYVIRWLAANIPLRDSDVELVGMDLNSTLTNEANRLAGLEQLPCQFLQGDAFSGGTFGPDFPFDGRDSPLSGPGVA